MRPRAKTTILAASASLIALATPAVTLAGPRTAPHTTFPVGVTTLMSVPANGGSNGAASGHPSLDNTGDVAFTSNAALSPDDSHAGGDIYLRTANGSTKLISRTPGGAAGNGTSLEPAISHDGRFIAFTSAATNIATSGPSGNGSNQVFLYDRDPIGNGLDGSDYTITMVSVSDGAPATPDGASGQPSVTAIGGSPFVTFQSGADNIVAGDTNGDADLFLAHGGTTTRVSLANNGDQANGSSAHPAVSVTKSNIFIGFDSAAQNLTAGDTNGFDDVFLRTIPRPSGTPTTVMWSFNGNGPSDYPSISTSGKRMVYTSTANQHGNPSFAHLYLAEAPGSADDIPVTLIGHPVISGDGKSIAYEGASQQTFNGLAVGSHDYIYVYTVASGLFFGISVSSANDEPNGNSLQPALARTGSKVAFASGAGNLVTGDTNHKQDVFLRLRDSTAPAKPTLTPSSLGWSKQGRLTIVTHDNAGSIRSGVAGFYAVLGKKTDKTQLGNSPYFFVGVHKGHHSLTSHASAFCPSCPNGVAPSGRYYLRARAIDREGNLSAYVELGPIEVDHDGPVITASLKPAHGASLKARIRWSAKDPQSGVRDFTLTYANNSARHVKTHIVFKHSTKHSATVTVPGGGIYIFTLHARDKVGNTNYRFIGQLNAPTPAARLTFPHGWQKKSSKAYYGGVAAEAGLKGASFRLKDNQGAFFQLALVVTKCSSCGKLKLQAYSPAGHAVKGDAIVVNLHSASTRHRVLLAPTIRPACAQQGSCSPKVAYIKVRVVSPSLEPVFIEGIQALPLLSIQ